MIYLSHRCIYNNNIEKVHNSDVISRDFMRKIKLYQVSPENALNQLGAMQPFRLPKYSSRVKPSEGSLNLSGGEKSSHIFQVDTSNASESLSTLCWKTCMSSMYVCMYE